MYKSIVLKQGTVLDKLTPEGVIRITLEQDIVAAKNPRTGVIKIKGAFYTPVLFTVEQATEQAKITKKEIVT